MILAKNNIILRIKDRGEYAILNPVSGSFDLMDEREYGMLQDLEAGRPAELSFAEDLLERGYAYETQEAAEQADRAAYEAFQKEIEDTQVQLMLIPTYGCNLACAYCYQHGIPAEHEIIRRETVDAFFDYARAHFSDRSRKPFITLFGGEPLINSPVQREIIRYIVDRCAKEGYEIAAVTNGYDFVHFVDILKQAKIKEIQFTLDGSREVHNRRRATANHQGTFDQVIEGIDAAVKNNIPVNLRTVVDLENIEDLVHLAEFLDSRHWLDLPPERFKTQIGRNYELFDCYAKPQHLMTQAALWAEYSALCKQYPILEKFHRPDFYGVRHIVDTKEMYMASYDTCPAAKTEWVFDLHGEIYGCTASCGRQEYLLGTYYPEVKLKEDAISQWQKRDVKHIDACKDCKYDVICGGGCGVIAANNHCGNALSPDCRPVRELLETGVNHYAEDLRAMASDEAPAVSPEDTACASGCCCGTGHETEGCLICGGKIEYSNTPIRAKCAICGGEFETHSICANGHYVCDHCHSRDILSRIEGLLNASTEQDPIALATSLFDLPDLNMHGPEYHSIVPAVLVTAYQNVTGERKPEEIAEAIRRGKDIKGGSCGFAGTCGAAVGAGIAVSILEQATPMSNAERGNAMAASGNAMLAISEYGGPRCCKRDAVTTMKTFLKTTDYFDSVRLSPYVCRQFHNNKTCIRAKCPYYPFPGSGEEGDSI